MGTKVYGSRDDLIVIEGDYQGEAYGNKDQDSTMLAFSDGTILFVRYDDEAIWRISIKNKGTLFDRIEVCASNNPLEDYSDVVYFKAGVAWAYEGNSARKIA